MLSGQADEMVLSRCFSAEGRTSSASMSEARESKDSRRAGRRNGGAPLQSVASTDSLPRLRSWASSGSSASA